MKNSELLEVIETLFEASSHGVYLPLIVWGEAGVGKSDTVKNAARKLDIDFIDLRLGNIEAPDLMGQMRDEKVYPCIMDLEAGVPPHLLEKFTAAGLWHHVQIHYPNQIPAAYRSDPVKFVDYNLEQARKKGFGTLVETRTVYSAPSWFPAPGTSGILFLDEMNRSSPDTRQGVFQLVLDRRIHELELPAGWIIVSANNPPQSRSGVSYDVDDWQDKAFFNRFCHVVLSASPVEWTVWAKAHGVDPTIVSFLDPATSDVERSSKLLGMRGADLPTLEPTPRGWALLGRFLSHATHLSYAVTRQIVAGTVSEVAFRSSDTRTPTLPVTDEFMAFREQPSPYYTIEKIVDLYRERDADARKQAEAFLKTHPEDLGSLLLAAIEDVMPRHGLILRGSP